MVFKPIWAILGAAATISCSDNESNHDLINLSGISPKVFESGDTLQITGSGFAEGSPARVSFRGDILRAGQSPGLDVEVVVRTQDTSKDTISFQVNDELERAFSGTGDSAAHASFQGTVTLSFAPGAGSLAPVSGTLRGVKLEVIPRTRSAQAASEQQKLAQQAVSYLGLGLTDEGTTDCCTVASSQGRALLAGIKPGDRLVQFDGLPVRSLSDLIPAGRHRTASVWIRRENSTQPVVRNIDVQGFRWTVPSELAPAFAVLVLVLGCFLGLASPIRKIFTSLCLSVAKAFSRPLSPPHLRSVVITGFSMLRRYLSDLPLPDLAVLRIAQVSAVIALGGLCGLLSVREELVSAELDLILWWLVSSVAVSLATFVYGISRLQGRFLSSAWLAVQSLAHQLPLLMLIAISILVTRSSRMADIVRVQGAWPHSWLIFHDPAFTGASLLAISALIPVADGAMPTETPAIVAASAVLHKRAHLPAVMLLTFLTNRVHLWLQSILLVVLLFGGWAVPFDGGYISQVRGLWLFMPTIVLLIKAWSMSSVLSFARTLFRSTTYRHSTPWALKFGGILSLLLGFLVLLWESVLRHWSLQWADAAMRWAMLSLVVVLLLHFALRTRGRIGTRIRTPLENYWM